jgi:hypothetical protein
MNKFMNKYSNYMVVGINPDFKEFNWLYTRGAFGGGGGFNTVIPQANFVNNRSFF